MLTIIITITNTATVAESSRQHSHTFGELPADEAAFLLSVSVRAERPSTSPFHDVIRGDRCPLFQQNGGHLDRKSLQQLQHVLLGTRAGLDDQQLVGFLNLWTVKGPHAASITVIAARHRFMQTADIHHPSLPRLVRQRLPRCKTKSLKVDVISCHSLYCSRLVKSLR